MSNIVVENLRCMACAHEYQESVEKGVDRERSCPQCRSNSIRVVKAPKAAKPAKPTKTAKPAQTAKPAKKE